MINSLDQLALDAASAAADKKAKNIVILNIHELTPMADYFVICSANSGTQIDAIAQSVEERLESLGIVCKGIEGKDESRWVLMDFGDIIVHIFRPEEREFYNLERLWGDAKQLPFSEE
jgi:ribosome-associated protein